MLTEICTLFLYIWVNKRFLFCKHETYIYLNIYLNLIIISTTKKKEIYFKAYYTHNETQPVLYEYNHIRGKLLYKTTKYLRRTAQRLTQIHAYNYYGFMASGPFDSITRDVSEWPTPSLSLLKASSRTSVYKQLYCTQHSKETLEVNTITNRLSVETFCK